MNTSRTIRLLRRCMRPRRAIHVFLTVIVAVFAGTGLLTGLLYSQYAPAAAGLPGIMLIWFWYVWRVNRVNAMIDDVIADAGEEALATDFSQAQKYGSKLYLGRRYAYHLEYRRILPLQTLRQLLMDNTCRPKSAGSDHSEPATRLIYVDDAGQRGDFVILYRHSVLLAPIIKQILTDVPQCVLLYDVKDDVAEFAQQLCAALCREHPETGFIRQHDAQKRMYGISRMLQDGFVILPVSVPPAA